MAEPITITPVGVRRRLEALQALGYPAEQLAVALGFPQLGAAAIDILCQQHRINPDTATRVADLYERLSGAVGPCPITRCTARAAGMAGPLAWDDDTIDNPHAAPVGVRPFDPVEAYHAGTPQPPGRRRRDPTRGADPTVVLARIGDAINQRAADHVRQLAAAGRIRRRRRVA